MYFYIKELSLAFIAWIIYTFVRTQLEQRRLVRWGKENGCADPPMAKNKFPLGLDRLYRLLTAKKGTIDFLEDFLRARYKEMGVNTFHVHNMSGTTLLTAEPANIQALLATQFTDFDLGPSRKLLFGEMIGDGIFTSQREEWVHYRQQLKPQFTREQVSDLDTAGKHLEILFKSLPKEDEKGWLNVDLMPYLYRLTLDVSTEFLFGESVNSQSTAVKAQDGTLDAEMRTNMEFADSMTYAQEFISFRMRIYPFYFLMPRKKFDHACAVLKNFADRFVVRALAPKSQLQRETEEKSKYVLLQELTKEIRDPVVLRDQVLQILLAGRDTTSASIGWTLALLARNPEIFKTLRKTIIQDFGTASNPTQPLTFSSLKSCKSLTHALYESLRLYPLVPINGRTAMKDTTLPVGGGKDGKQKVVVKKGNEIGYTAYVMHRRKDLWGEDADEFRPGRWEGRKLGWDFLGFSGGPRVCLGQQYALNEMGFVLVKILQKYDIIEAQNMTAPLKKALTVIMAPGEGAVEVKLHRANE